MLESTTWLESLLFLGQLFFTAYPIELIHGLHCDLFGGPPPFVRHSEDSSIIWLTPGQGSDTTYRDYGHHLSPHWYDIVHFGPKPSWICSWTIPQKASYQWRYLSILIYPWSSPFLANVGLWSYTQQMGISTSIYFFIARKPLLTVGGQNLEDASRVFARFLLDCCYLFNHVSNFTMCCFLFKKKKVMRIGFKSL